MILIPATASTADVYGNGESEVLVGKFLKKYNIPREKMVILTKVGNSRSSFSDCLVLIEYFATGLYDCPRRPQHSSRYPRRPRSGWLCQPTRALSQAHLRRYRRITRATRHKPC